MQHKPLQLGTSILVCCLTVLLTFSGISNYLIKPRLYDGSINELGRYSFTFDAYEYISETSENPVIALGSSKMREIFDGQLMSDLTFEEIDFFNLAYAGERPYVRMIEIDAIIALQPRLVILEIGPNTFSRLSDPLPESIQGRMSQLMSLNSEWKIQSWRAIISEEDQRVLPLERIEQLEYYSNLAPEALDSTLSYELGILEKPYSCDNDWGTVHCVPSPYSEAYPDYLKYPIQFRNSLKVIKDGKSKITIEEFYGDRLDKYLAGSYHNPEGAMNKNQKAYEFMIENLIENNISVLIIGLPYNPVLLDRLSDGQWDYYNTTVTEYRTKFDVHVIDLMWNGLLEEDDFNDYTHAARSGEEIFAEYISPELTMILS
jgi:hypothetical protein